MWSTKRCLDKKLTETLLERKEENILWYGNMRRMNEVGLPLQTEQKRRRPRKTWTENIAEAMRKIGIDEVTITNRKT